MYIKKNKFTLFFSFIIMFILAYFYSYGNDSLLTIDAMYYSDFYLRKDFTLDTIISIFIMNKNLLPPLVQLYIVNNNLDVLFYVYSTSLFLSIYSSIKYIKYNKNIFIILITLFPVVIINLYGVNKEIVSYISILFLLSYILSKRIKFLLFALFFSLFARVELIFIILFFYLTIKNKHRVIIIIMLLLLISLIIKLIGYSDNNRLIDGARESSLGLVMYIDYLNTLGLYFVTYVLKLIINLYALVVVPSINSIYGLSLTISSYLFLILSFIVIKKRAFNISNDIVYFILLYSMVFCIPSFVQHRYFVSLYPLFVYLAFSLKNHKVHK